MTTTGSDLDMTLIDSRPGIKAVYEQIVIEASVPIEATRTRGRTILITAKFGPSAQLHVDRLELGVDQVFGRAWREGKADVLRAEGASMYVGDHVHDMEAARSSGAFGVGVTTGPCTAVELVEAGAGHVLTGLADFPDWLERQA